MGDDLTYAVVADDDDNVYMAGYYEETDTLFIDESEDNTVMSIGNSQGNFDFLVAKYNSDGDLLWYRTTGVHPLIS